MHSFVPIASFHLERQQLHPNFAAHTSQAASSAASISLTDASPHLATALTDPLRFCQIVRHAVHRPSIAWEITQLPITNQPPNNSNTPPMGHMLYARSTRSLLHPHLLFQTSHYTTFTLHDSNSPMTCTTAGLPISAPYASTSTPVSLIAPHVCHCSRRLSINPLILIRHSFSLTLS